MVYGNIKEVDIDVPERKKSPIRNKAQKLEKKICENDTTPRPSRRMHRIKS